MLSEKVRNLNLECIAFKVAYDEGWSLEAVERAELHYRCYLQAILDHPNCRLAPTKEIDVFWHHHILDTQKYMDDCVSVLGFYLHHFPYSGLRSETDEHEQRHRAALSLQFIENIATGERNHHATCNQ